MVLGNDFCDGFVFVGNFVYLNALDRDSIAFAANDRVAVAASEKMFGSVNDYYGGSRDDFYFGCVNGIVLAGARVFQTMAKDGLFLKSAIENNKNGVPEKISLDAGNLGFTSRFERTIRRFIDMISL